MPPRLPVWALRRRKDCQGIIADELPRRQQILALHNHYRCTTKEQIVATRRFHVTLESEKHHGRQTENRSENSWARRWRDGGANLLRCRERPGAGFRTGAALERQS